MTCLCEIAWLGAALAALSMSEQEFSRPHVLSRLQPGPFTSQLMELRFFTLEAARLNV
jgi:hypothetical protein